MGTTLQHGIFLPAEGERNCYAGLASNWTILDGVVGGYSSHAANLTIHVTAADKEAWNGKADTSALTAHTGNTTIHVTASDKQTWNGKQDALSQTQLDAVNSGIDSSKVQQIATNTSDISSLQSGKANDSDVVHKSGDETVGGTKTFNSNTFIYNSDPNATTPNLYLKSSKIVISSQGNTSGDQNLVYLDKNNTDYAYIKGAIQSNGSAVKIRAVAKDSSNNSVINELQMLAYTNGNKAIFPTYSNEVDLGVSNYKWKSVYATNYYYGSNNVEFSTKFVTTDTNQTITGNKTFSSINGVEPSSLSLPSDNSSNVVDISSYITYFDGTLNRYVPPANGWIGIYVNNCTELYMKIDNLWGKNVCRSDAGKLVLLMPVPKGKGVDIQIFATGTLRYARFVPCSGNV